MITRRDFLKVTGAAAAAAALTACGGSSSTASSAASGTASSAASSAVAKLDKVKVAVPNDTTNEARALTLLEKNGFFKLKADAGLTATAKDIEENPLNVSVDEVEAAQVPNVLQDEDYAVINSNYAISAGLDPMTDALAMEDGTSAYVNILVCKDGNQEEPKIKALAAALQSQKVKDFMDENYKGAVVSVVENPTDGYDSSIDYDALNGETVSCAATPAPHCEVLEICKDILAEKGITLDIQEYDDYIIPNNIVEDGQCDTNYFQHQPYLDDFNAEHGTHLVTVAGIHVEPMGIYGGKQDSPGTDRGLSKPPQSPCGDTCPGGRGLCLTVLVSGSLHGREHRQTRRGLTEGVYSTARSNFCDRDQTSFQDLPDEGRRGECAEEHQPHHPGWFHLWHHRHVRCGQIHAGALHQPAGTPHRGQRCDRRHRYGDFKRSPAA